MEEQRMDVEGDCKSTHTLGNAKLCRNILISTDVRTSEYITATEPSPSSSSTEDGFASTSGCKPSASDDDDGEENSVTSIRRPELPNHVDPLLRLLLHRCRRLDPLERPSSAEIVECVNKVHDLKVELESDEARRTTTMSVPLVEAAANQASVLSTSCVHVEPSKDAVW